jgi:hypothetical protein
MRQEAFQRPLVVGLVAMLTALCGAGQADAANGAYAVDAADISDLGSCKVESWLSVARNSDFTAVANPSCVVDLGRPVEVSTQLSRSRAGGDWSTGLAPKAKFNIEPTGIGKLGYSFYGGGGFDAQTGENTSVFAVIPATWRLSETMRFNFNGGWLWDRSSNRHFMTYGVGYDWKFTDVLQLTLETFGQLGDAVTPSAGRPRFQAGVRYRPGEIFSVDLIVGRNITGENSNWITLGTTYRFPATEPAREPSPHL